MLAMPLAALALAAAPVAGAAEQSDLELVRASSPPRTIAAGAEFVHRVRIENRGDAPGSGVLKTTLVGGRGAGPVPRRIGRFPSEALAPGAYRRFTLLLTVPRNQRAARYRLRTCLKADGGERCRLSRRFRITA